MTILLSRPDCEAAIKQILARTKGKCPLCPKTWEWRAGSNLDWTIYIHFSRSHRITENLTFNDNQFSQQNVDTILKIAFPHDYD